MCAQEFALPEVIRLWDSIFADRTGGEGATAGFEFLIDFCCAMLLYVGSTLQSACQHNFDGITYPCSCYLVVSRMSYCTEHLLKMLSFCRQVIILVLSHYCLHGVFLNNKMNISYLPQRTFQFKIQK
jgi:hypothetical protein